MITGKALPPVTEDLPPPTQSELDELHARWDATVPAYYKTLLIAGRPESRFDYDKRRLKYIHRKTGRVLTDKEIKRVFLLFTSGLKVR